MTLLGSHTIAETRALMAAMRYRVAQNEAQLARVQAVRGPPTLAQAGLDRDFADFLEHWNRVCERASLSMVATMLAAPWLLPSVAPAEREYQAIDGALRVRVPHFKDLEQRVNAEAALLDLAPTDLSAMPAPGDATDWDMAAFKKVDGLIAAGESAASSSRPWLLLGAGALAVLGVVVVTKVYF